MRASRMRPGLAALVAVLWLTGCGPADPTSAGATTPVNRTPLEIINAALAASVDAPKHVTGSTSRGNLQLGFLIDDGGPVRRYQLGLGHGTVVRRIGDAYVAFVNSHYRSIDPGRIAPIIAAADHAWPPLELLAGATDMVAVGDQGAFVGHLDISKAVAATTDATAAAAMSAIPTTGGRFLLTVGIQRGQVTMLSYDNADGSYRTDVMYTYDGPDLVSTPPTDQVSPATEDDYRVLASYSF